MNTKIITLVILMIVSACTKSPYAENESCADRNTLTVDLGLARTRVYVDGVRTLLQSEDLFSVFYRSCVNEQWVYTGNDGSTDGTLTACTATGSIEDTDKIHAVYPWTESASLTNGIITTELPDVQYFAKDSYGRGAAVLAARTSTAQQPLNFRYASGFIRLRIIGNAKIKDILLSSGGGEALSGACTIDMNGDAPVLKATGSSSVLLRNLDFSPITMDGTEEFIFSVAPGTYRKGVTFDIAYTTGQVQTVKTSEPLTVAAGVLATPVEAVAQPLFTIEVNFYTGGAEVASPFDVTLTKDIVPGTTGSTSVSKNIYLKTDTAKKYPFRFYIGNKDKTDNLRVTRSGLSFGGTAGDYILLPGIEGMRLVSAMVIGSNCTVSLNSEESVTPTAFINVAGAESGKACKLELCSDNIAKILNLSLYYDTVL